MSVPARGRGELRIGITDQGAAVELERDGLRLGIERTWGGQTRFGLYYRRAL